MSIYVATPQSVVRKMLLMAELKHGETVYDLGCGDGRVVITAAQEFGARGVGVERRKDLVRKVQKTVSELGLDGLVKIVHGNLFEVNIAQADVVTLYLTMRDNEKLKPKLERELKPDARVVSHNFPIPGWKPKKKEHIREYSEFSLLRRIFSPPPWHTVYLYTIPKDPF